MKKHFDTESFVLGTFVGAAIAGVTALLFAPKSGEDLRDDIGSQADKVKGQAKDYMHLAKDKGLELKDSAEKKGQEYLENASATYHQLTHQVGSELDETKENLDQIKEEAKETAKDMKDSVEEKVTDHSDEKFGPNDPRDVTDTREAKEPEGEDAREDTDLEPNEGPQISSDPKDSLQDQEVENSDTTERTKDYDYNSND